MGHSCINQHNSSTGITITSRIMEPTIKKVFVTIWMIVKFYLFLLCFCIFIKRRLRNELGMWGEQKPFRNKMSHTYFLFGNVNPRAVIWFDDSPEETEMQMTVKMKLNLFYIHKLLFKHKSNIKMFHISTRRRSVLCGWQNLLIDLSIFQKTTVTYVIWRLRWYWWWRSKWHCIVTYFSCRTASTSQTRKVKRRKLLSWHNMMVRWQEKNWAKNFCSHTHGMVTWTSSHPRYLINLYYLKLYMRCSIQFLALCRPVFLICTHTFIFATQK